MKKSPLRKQIERLQAEIANLKESLRNRDEAIAIYKGIIAKLKNAGHELH